MTVDIEWTVWLCETDEGTVKYKALLDWLIPRGLDVFDDEGTGEGAFGGMWQGVAPRSRFDPLKFIAFLKSLPWLLPGVTVGFSFEQIQGVFAYRLADPMPDESTELGWLLQENSGHTREVSDEV
ncbi:MAG: hypothetical protein AABY75_05575 [Bacteroidota bacterium]